MRKTPLRTADGLCDKQCFIFDLDGTLYRGPRLLPHALELIHALRDAGKQVIFYTNNASKSHTVYERQLTDMGFDPRPGEIVTSGDITVDYLTTERPGKRVFLLGTPQLTEQFRAAGISLVGLNEKSADVVVCSFDTTLTYEKMDVASRFIRHGAEFFATHPDLNCPTEDDLMPDCGSVAAFLATSGGKAPVFFGKPYPIGAEQIERRTGIDRRDMVMVGDWLYSDILFGNRNGISSLLVMTGATTEEVLAAAPDEAVPDIILPDLAPLCALFR